MTAERIAAIKQRLAAATPGEWVADAAPWLGLKFGVMVDLFAIATCHEIEPESDRFNATFIANAPADVAWLLGELKAATEVIAMARAIDYRDALLGQPFQALADALEAYDILSNMDGLEADLEEEFPAETAKVNAAIRSIAAAPTLAAMRAEEGE